MKTRIIIAVIFLCCTASMTAELKACINSVEGLSLRASASLSAERIVVIPYKAEVTIHKHSDIINKIDKLTDYWNYVSYKGKKGWIFGAYLSSEQDKIGKDQEFQKQVQSGKYIDPWSAEVGDRNNGMKIAEITKKPYQSENLVRPISFSILFSGNIEISGSYRYVQDDEMFGPNIWFTPKNINDLPRIAGRGNIEVCLICDDIVKREILKKGNRGNITIKIDEYDHFYLPFGGCSWFKVISVK